MKTVKFIGGLLSLFVLLFFVGAGVGSFLNRIWEPPGTMLAHVRLIEVNPDATLYLACKWNPETKVLDCLDLDRFLKTLSGTGPDQAPTKTQTEESI